MTDTMVLAFNDTEVRSITEENEIWFALVDVCKILELSNSRMVADYLDDDERRKFNLPRQGNTWFVNEPGLYHVTLASKSEKAVPFRRWVTHEVLPSIRKQGFYSLLPDQELIDLLVKRQSENPTFLREAAVDLKSKKALEQLAQDAQLRELWKQRADLPLGEYKSRLDVICNGNFTLLNKETKKYEKWYTAFKARKVDYSL